MKTWPEQDAKSQFSELLETCLREGPQLITRGGEKAAVLVPAEDWENLSRSRQPTLKEWLLADSPRGNLNTPSRGKLRRRQPPV